MASFTFEVLTDCDFAGIPLRRGMVLVVRPGHAARPITAHLALPPNYGVLLTLMADDSIRARDPFAGMPAVDRPSRPLPRSRRHLQLMR